MNVHEDSGGLSEVSPAMSGNGGYGGSGGFPPQHAAPYGGYQAGGGSRDLNTIQLARPDFSSLATFEKNFYIEHPAVAARSEADVQAYRQLREIHVDGVGIPKPVVTFDEASFPGRLATALFGMAKPVLQPT